jgi:hypothetical protein
MTDPSVLADQVDARLRAKASEIVRTYGPAVHGLLVEMNETRLDGQGRLTSAEIGRKAIRWELEWNVEPVSYRIHVGVTIGDDGEKAFVDRVLVQREASAPYSFEGHTPTTMMKQVAHLDVEEIRAKLIEVWPQ